MESSTPSPPGLLRSARRWWRDTAAREGRLAATSQLVSKLWEFVRDSTPQRRRQRFGDADYDWEHRVNTTSGAVGWRERLLGIFHSPYQPTEPALFREMLEALRSQAGIDFRDFIFLDLGSGKGRTLLMASDYPFRRVLGVELLPALHRIAQENLDRRRGPTQPCLRLEAICADATEFPFPLEPTVLYLFNPFPEAGLRKVVARLRDSLSTCPRPAYVLYHNFLLEAVFEEAGFLQKIGGTHQYSIFATR